MPRYANEQDTTCAECGSSFKVPFVQSGRVYYCPTCSIQNNDMRQSSYFKELIIYLYERLGLKDEKNELVSRRSQGSTYEILMNKKDVNESQYICTTIWEPKDPLRVFSPNGDSMAIVSIKAKDRKIEKIIEEFVKKHGIEAKVPTDSPVKKF